MRYSFINTKCQIPLIGLARLAWVRPRFTELSQTAARISGSYWFLTGAIWALSDTSTTPTEYEVSFTKPNVSLLPNQCHHLEIETLCCWGQHVSCLWFPCRILLLFRVASSSGSLPQKIPTHRLTHLKVPIHPPSQHLIIVLRSQSESWPHHAQILWRQDIAFLNIRSYV